MEFLHTGLQKLRSILNDSPHKKRFAENHYKALRFLARTYCSLGDFRKSACFIEYHKTLREDEFDFLELTEEIKAEEDLYLELESLLWYKKDPEEKFKSILKVERCLKEMESNDPYIVLSTRFQQICLHHTIDLLFEMQLKLSKEINIYEAITYMFELTNIFNTRKDLFYHSNEINSTELLEFL